MSLRYYFMVKLRTFSLKRVLVLQYAYGIWWFRPKHLDTGENVKIITN